MTAKAGKDFLLKDGTGTGAVTVAAMRTTSFSIEGEAVDVTTKDSAGFRELLSGAGVTSMTVQAAGVLKAGTGLDTLLTRVRDKSVDLYTLNFGGADKIEGSFQITSFEASGEYNGEQTYSATLESSGSFTFTGAGT